MTDSQHNHDETQSSHILVSQLKVRHKQSVILDIPQLRLPQRSLIILLGANGSGKTTFLRALAGWQPAPKGLNLASGIITYSEQPSCCPPTLSQTSVLQASAEDLSLRRNWLPAQSSVAFDYRVDDILDMSLFPWRMRRKELDASAAERQRIIHSLKLQKLMTRSFSSLSSGEQKLVLIAARLQAPCPIHLLDEPFAHLDLAAALRLLRCITELSARKTVIMSVHRFELVLQLRTAFLVALKKGTLTTAGPLASTLSSSLINELYELDTDLETQLTADALTGKKLLIYPSVERPCSDTTDDTQASSTSSTKMPPVDLG